MAQNEIYHIGIGISVSGDKETKAKLTNIEKQADKLKKAKINATAKITDKASSVMDKIEAKTKKFKDKTISATAKVKDSATATLDKVKNATDKINNKEAKVKVKAEDEASSVIEKANSKLNSWLKAGAKKVISIGLAGSLAVGGLGLGASLKTYTDFEQGLSNVKAVTNATAQEMATLKKEAKDLGASTVWSAVQVTQAEELLGQAGFSVKETTSALPGLLNLASAGSLDLAQATDIASGTLRAFNLQASQSGHVADVLALSASATNSDVTDLGETMKYAAPVAQSLGISFEDTAAASGLLSNANIKGSQAGTILRQTMARLASPTKEAAKIMQKYGINAFDAQGNMKPLSGVVDNLNSSLGKLTSQQRADVISTVFGTESMSGVLALMNQGGTSLSDLSSQLKEANGAADKMADTKLDNLAGQWTILKSAVEGMKIELGERLAPYAKQFVTWITGKIPDITNGIVGLVDSISKHTDDIKGVAVAIGGIVTAIGGLSVAGSIGNSLSGVAKLVTLFKGASVAGEATKVASSFSVMGLAAKALPLLFSPAGAAITAGVAATAVGVHEYNKLMDESILTAKEDLDPIERFMDSVMGNKHKTKQELQDLGLAYSDFGSDVSDSFKSAAKEASKSLLELEMNINRLGRDGGIKEDNMDAFKNYVNTFTYSGINEMKARQDEIKTELTKTFSLDGVVSESEQGTLDGLNRFYEEGINKQLEIRDEIYNIGDSAIKDHDSILDEDLAQIKEKLAELQSLKLEYANAKTAGEAAYASSKFQSESEKVTGLEGASELLQSRIKDRDDKITEAKANYDGSIAEIQYLMDNTDNETDKSNYEKTMSDLKEARDKSIDTAMESYKSDLETFYESNGEYKGRINEDTGEVLSKRELKSRDTMTKIEDNHTGLSDITESGVYALQNSVNGNLDTVYVSVDEKTKEIKGLINGATGEIGASSDEQKSKLEELQGEYHNTGAAMQSLATQGIMYNSSTGEVINATTNEKTALEDVTTAADGTVTGILNVNGTPIQITSNADGTITKMEEVTSATDSIPSDTEANVSTNADEAASEITGVTESASLVPADTPANVSTNADSATSSFESLYDSIMSIPAVKTVTVTVKKIIDEVKDPNNWIPELVPRKNAMGTENATAGLSTVNEQGWELADRTVPVIGRYNNNPLVNLQRGTKIKSHMNSMSEMKQDVKQEVAKQAPKQQVQVYQPQLTMAGGQGNSFSFGGFNININNNNDIMQMVQEAQNQFGQQLLQVLQGIKK